MKLSDLVIPTNVPKIEHVKWEWYEGYYDGPLSGVVTIPSPDGDVIAGHPVRVYRLAVAVEENDNYHIEGDPLDHWYRRYVVIEHDNITMTEIFNRHALFCKYVGNHMNIDQETGKRKLGDLKPTEEWKKYYDIAHTWDYIDDTQGIAVGWFYR